MAEIGKPLRRVIVIPSEHPISAPEEPRRRINKPEKTPSPTKSPEKEPV
jgi:hypothetical protein